MHSVRGGQHGCRDLGGDREGLVLLGTAEQLVKTWCQGARAYQRRCSAAQ
jgi:hypothetical protein